MKVSKRIIIAIVVSLIVFLLYQCTSQEENVENVKSPAEIVTSEESVYDALKGLEKADIEFEMTETSEKMFKEYPGYYDGSNSEDSVMDRIDFALAYDEVVNNLEENGDKLILLPDVTVISINRSENENGITMVELLDDDWNYYLMVSADKFENVKEGEYIGGFYTPAGKMTFVNKQGEVSEGIVGATVLLGE